MVALRGRKAQLLEDVLDVLLDTGEDWDNPVIPGDRLEPLIAESSLHIYETIG